MSERPALSLSDGELRRPGAVTERPLGQGQRQPVSDGGGCPPTLEFEFAVRAGELTFRSIGDVHIHTEGTARTERVRQRDGLPCPVEPGVRYTGVRVFSQLRAWLDEAGPGEDGRAAPPEGQAAGG